MPICTIRVSKTKQLMPPSAMRLPERMMVVTAEVMAMARARIFCVVNGGSRHRINVLKPKMTMANRALSSKIIPPHMATLLLLGLNPAVC